MSELQRCEALAALERRMQSPHVALRVVRQPVPVLATVHSGQMKPLAPILQTHQPSLAVAQSLRQAKVPWR